LESARDLGVKALRPEEKLKKPNFADPLPVADFIAGVAKRVEEMAGAFKTAEPGAKKPTSAKQTVTLHGNRPERLTPHDPTEPPPKHFASPAAPKGIAPADVAEIVAEMWVPAFKPDVVDHAITDLAFREEVMRAYQHDVPMPEVLKNKEKYP